MTMARMVGLDLGTTYTRIWTPDGGVVLRCPSAAAIDSESHRLVALGVEARRMLGRTPQDILAYRPITEGLVSESGVAARMVHAMFLNKRICSTFKRPVVLLATPYRISEVQQLAAENTVMEGGARAVKQIPAVYAAAVGAGLRVSSPRGCMILNIGGGITEVAVISAGDIIAARSIPVAGERFDADIIHYLKKRRNLVVGRPMAEELRIRIGSADGISGTAGDRAGMTAYGRNERTGLASRQEVFSAEITEAITPALNIIMRGVLAVLEDVPPEIASDVYDTGLMLSGGCAEMPGLSSAIRRATGLRVTVAREPRDCVINGLGRLIKHPILGEAQLNDRWK